MTMLKLRRMMIYGLIIVNTIVVTIALTAPAVFCEEDEKAGDGIRTIYLVRHGDYDGEDPRDPDIGKALLPLGVAQARLVAARLQSLPLGRTTLYSSTMTRARQTAMVMAEDFPGLELNQTRLLRECTPPTWRRDIMDREDPTDLRACQGQLEKAYQTLFIPSPDRDQHDILVCHGNVIRYFVTKVLKVDTEAWLGMAVSNCSLTVVRIRPDGSMKLVSYNDTGHIPANMITETGMDTTPIQLRVPGE